MELSIMVLKDSLQLQKAFRIPEVYFNIDDLIAHEQLTDHWKDYILDFSLEEVRSAILRLKSGRNPGPMKISALFIQHNIDTLAPVMCWINNAIILTGYFPADVKHSYSVPIPMKGSSNDAKNHRGIAIQSCLPKILDYLITKKMMFHLRSAILDNQHGFINARGTTSNLLELTEFLHIQMKLEN